MRMVIVPVVLAVLGAVVSAEAQEVGEEMRAKPEDLKERIAYSLGLNLGKNMAEQGADIDVEFFASGLQDGMTEAEPLLTDEEIQETMLAFREQLTARQKARTVALAEKNAAEGEAFLAKNKEKEGVVVLPSGLQYEVIEEGTGPTPKAEDKVTVNYRGTLIDGTVFDSSYDRGEPITFPVNGVIAGWTEALQLMKVGSKWKLCIPSNLAYGERGAGATIGPNATLLFDVELLAIEGK